MAVPDYFRFFYFSFLHVHVHCVHDIFQLAPLWNPIFLQKCSHFCGPQNSPDPFSGGVSDVEPYFFAVLRSAKRVCANRKVQMSAENGCDVRTLNNQGPHLSLRYVALYCVTFTSSKPCQVQGFLRINFTRRSWRSRRLVSLAPP